MSDHGDHAVGKHDLTDLYVFRKPGDPDRTILVMDLDSDAVPNGDPGAPPWERPFDADAKYDFMIDTDGDAVPDRTLRISFSNDAAGRQAGAVHQLIGDHGAKLTGAGSIVLRDAPVSPTSEPLVTARGEVAFFAGRRSDPFFEDLIGKRNNFQWTGQDYLAGHNISAIVLEVPNDQLGPHSPVGIWARVCVPRGQGRLFQADRIGRPFANVVFNDRDKEAQDAFNKVRPADDRRLSLDRLTSYFEGTGRSADEAAAVAATLLPDLLTYDWTTESGFPNGRTLTDDVSDWMWALVTNGTASNDGIGPHTDLLADFPYLGPPHTDRSRTG